MGDIVPYLGGQYRYSASEGRVQLALGDKTLQAFVRQRNGSARVPVCSVWEAMGALVTWDKTRQRLTGAFVLPAGVKLADFARGGSAPEETLLSQKAEFRLSADGVRMADVIVGCQNAGGGWQQVWPPPQGYKARITLNGDAIASMLEVLRDAAERKPVRPVTKACN